MRRDPAASGGSAPSVQADPERSNFLVVGVGASAGGLEACKAFISAIPTDSGLAIVLVQHLDPTHKSMLPDLLSAQTDLTVLQATEGMPVEKDHLYVIPPGRYLAVQNGVLQLSAPKERHGSRLPFDFLLESIGDAYGERAVGVVLSGTGADGAVGLRRVKENGGFIIAQDPNDSGSDGMPRSAIATGAVDLVLPAAKIFDALRGRAGYLAKKGHEGSGPGAASEAHSDGLAAVIELLRTHTTYDFTHYKPGTLKRRIEQRMAASGFRAAEVEPYVAALSKDSDKLDGLAKDLLINVTSFFRDIKAFNLLERDIVPNLIKAGSDSRTLRVWVAGCSTGEEAYSIAIVLLEAVEASKLSLKLQIFASDIDPDAIVTARDGLYPHLIAENVSAERLTRFFSKEERGYRVSHDLRDAVVFTVHDILSNPPFSRIDLVSCRNLLIYLSVKAQARAISLFHFALRPDGVLLLGSAETAGGAAGGFEIISKPERLYRRVGRSRPGEFGSSRIFTESDLLAKQGPRSGNPQGMSRQTALAELCRRLVIEGHAPAAVLINRQHECLYSLGPTERYLRVAPGHPTQDILTMVPQGVRNRLKAAIGQAGPKRQRTIVAGSSREQDDRTTPFTIEVQFVPNQDGELLLLCFLDDVARNSTHPSLPPATAGGASAELQRELDETRSELQDAIQGLQVSSDEHRAINEEALSLNEEYQSANQELLVSKEELESLNEELSALNNQLQDTLELQRTTSNDMENVLFSTDVATLFLDRSLNIRFFTPATATLFNIVDADIGRPLADLHSQASDRLLAHDAVAVLKNLSAFEREVEAEGDLWFCRKILPYRARDGQVEGVVITYTNITERKQTAKALELARRQSEAANIAKSRFLAAASHDLRQPLQSLKLIQGMLARDVREEKAQQLVARLDKTLGAMSGILNSLLDINQIETGTIRVDRSAFPINDILERLRDEFSYHAQAKRLELHVVLCSHWVESDPRLLEQMVRNLLANALKYTKKGKVLVGCRRRQGTLRIEIWDTGIGIPGDELQAIFEEYHQLDNSARERSRGLGLGLSIVQRLGALLNHPVTVHSQHSRGSVFAIEVMLTAFQPSMALNRGLAAGGNKAANAGGKGAAILVVEDDPEVRELLGVILEEEGHRPLLVEDGVAALALISHGDFTPDLILADYNLPRAMTGVELIGEVRNRTTIDIPAIVLTGDISTSALHDIASHNCVQLNKPVKLIELTSAIERLVASTLRPVIASPVDRRQATGEGVSAVVTIIDDDELVCEALRLVLEDEDYAVEAFSTGEAFLEAFEPGEASCVLIDAYLPGMNGIELLRQLRQAGHLLPAIMITGASDVGVAVQAMKSGASDFLEKPVAREDLIASIQRALSQSNDTNKLSALRDDAVDQLSGLTSRQRQIMKLVLDGHPSKNIASDLGISQRTVENHRFSIMHKTGCSSLPALARMAVAAAWGDTVDLAGKPSSLIGR